MTIVETASRQVLAQTPIGDFVPADELRAHFMALVVDQQERLDARRPACPVPLLWVALARVVGLAVDVDTGQIVDGPKNRPVVL
jgi:hypothetical protein